MDTEGNLNIEALEKIVRDRIRLTSAYSELLQAALRFKSSLYGKNSGEYAQAEREFICEPERLLTVHSCVMNCRSERCKSLRALADKVIEQAELPMKAPGKYRGMDYEPDWYAVDRKWGGQD